MIRTLLLGALAMLAACATTPADAARARTSTWCGISTRRPASATPTCCRRDSARRSLLAAWFGRERLRAIYVSDFRRTRQTAAPLARRGSA